MRADLGEIGRTARGVISVVVVWVCRVALQVRVVGGHGCCGGGGGSGVVLEQLRRDICEAAFLCLIPARKNRLGPGQALADLFSSISPFSFLLILHALHGVGVVEQASMPVVLTLHSLLIFFLFDTSFLSFSNSSSFSGRGDQSGFSVVSCVPWGWIQQGGGGSIPVFLFLVVRTKKEGMITLFPVRVGLSFGSDGDRFQR